MRTVDLIYRKREGEELRADEIQYLVDGYTRGEIPDYQMSAFLMAVVFSVIPVELWTNSNRFPGFVLTSA